VRAVLIYGDNSGTDFQQLIGNTHWWKSANCWYAECRTPYLRKKTVKIVFVIV